MTIVAVGISAAAAAIASPALAAPVHTLFGSSADQIAAGATIISVLAATIAGIGRSPLPSSSVDSRPLNEAANATSNPPIPATAGKADRS